jgi:hypothetical protein
LIIDVKPNTTALTIEPMKVNMSAIAILSLGSNCIIDNITVADTKTEASDALQNLVEGFTGFICRTSQVSHDRGWIGVGTGLGPAPPSEPDWRVSRIRLSG